MLVGLGLEDQCKQLSSSGSVQNMVICNSLKGATTPGSAVSLSLGGLYRVAARKVVSPYARVNVGLVVSQHSTIRMTATDEQGADFDVYADPRRSRLSPVLGLGVGFTAGLAPGLSAALGTARQYRRTGARHRGLPRPRSRFRRTRSSFRQCPERHVRLRRDPRAEAGTEILTRAAVRGAILAGGGATRFDGRPKGLERVGGTRILDRLVDAFTGRARRGPAAGRQ